MKNVIIIIFNFLLTALFSIVVLIIGNILLLDIFADNTVGHESLLVFGATLFTTLFVIGLIHVTIFLPILLISQKFIIENSIAKVYRTFIPILFILFVIYLWIGGAITSKIIGSGRRVHTFDFCIWFVSIHHSFCRTLSTTQ